MSAPGLTVTEFPVEGYNFRSQDGTVRGVASVIVATNGGITVVYVDDHVEEYPPQHVQEVTTR